LFCATFICLAKFSVQLHFNPYKLSHENRLAKLTELVQMLLIYHYFVMSDMLHADKEDFE
jgi:hypothetical protein